MQSRENIGHKKPQPKHDIILYEPYSMIQGKYEPAFA